MPTTIEIADTDVMDITPGVMVSGPEDTIEIEPAIDNNSELHPQDNLPADHKFAPLDEESVAPSGAYILKRVTTVYKTHELANLYPAMSDDEYDTLRADIKKTKRVLDPIVVIDGAIIDGRHRWRAIQDLWDVEQMDIPYTTVEFDPATMGDPFEYVHSKNFARRNMSATQKATIGVTYMEHFRSKGGRKVKGEKALGEARDRAAAISDVSATSISTAAMIKSADSHLYEQMRHGTKTVWEAAREIKKRTDQSERTNKVTKGTEKQPEPTLVKEAWANWHTARVAVVAGQKPEFVIRILETLQENNTVSYSSTVGIDGENGEKCGSGALADAKSLAEAKRICRAEVLSMLEIAYEKGILQRPE